MKILLTGAAGFVGSHLLTQLRQRELFVRAVSRTNRPGLALANDVVIENLTQHSDFKALLADIDTVIHLADGFNAYEHLPVSAPNKEASNRLQATIALADCAARNGAHFVYLSTIKTMCGAYCDHVLSETSIAQPQSLYGRLKLEAEQAILSASQKHHTKAVILRFPVVFGPKVGGNMEKLYQLAKSPVPLPFKGLDNTRSLISSDSLIDAVMTILTQIQTMEGIYLVHDGALSTTDMVKLIRQALGHPPRQFKLPSVFWSASEKLPLIGQKVFRLTSSLELDDHHFRKTCDWQPPEPLAKTLRQWAEHEKRESDA